MHAYTHAHTYSTHTHTHIHTSTQTTYKQIHIAIYVSVFVWACMRGCVCVHAYMCVVYICGYIYCIHMMCIYCLANKLCWISIGEGVDYFSGPYLVAFPAGMTTAAVTVQINDNTEYKDNSFYFTLAIISSTLINNVIIGETGHTTVTIIDDECKLWHGKFW